MTPGDAPPSGSRTSGGPAGSGWTRQELDIFSRRLGDRPRAAADDRAAPPPPRAPTARRRRNWHPAQAAALIVLGLALLAFLAGALTSGSDDPSAPQVATRLPAETDGPATEQPTSEATTTPTDAPAPSPAVAPARPDPSAPSPPPPSGDAVVRAFYDALGRGDGAQASALVVPEKRASRTYSPPAISRFYGTLREPLRLTAVTPLAPDAFRVRYRYSAGRSPCDGAAVVRLASRDGRDLIRSIRALNGC